MMSWFSELASKAENLLNNLDHSAAEAFNAPRSRGPSPVFDNSASGRAELPQTIPMFESDAMRPGWDELKESQGVVSNQEPIFQSDSSRLLQSDSLDWSRSTSQLKNSTAWNKSPSKTSSALEHPFDPNSRTQPVSAFGNRVDDGTNSSGYETFDSSHWPSSIGQPRESLDQSGRRREFDDHQNAVDHTLPRGVVPSTKLSLAQETTSDTKLENKILRSEVSSMSLEVSDLLKRNHKINEENKQLRGQVERLTSQLRDSDARVRELQVNLREAELNREESARSNESEEALKLADQLASANTELNGLRNQLEARTQTTTNLESSLQEARRQNEIAAKRAELAQKEASRLAKELAQYKEKATHILNMKEQLIASLRSPDTSEVAGGGSTVDQELVNTLRAECDMLREEVSRWRIEVDHRELAMQELEVQMQAERDSLRRNLDLVEQQAEREKQLREDADTELAQLRRRLRDTEDSMSRHKAELHAQLTASEAELGRLRHALARRNSSSPEQLKESAPSRTDPEHVLSLESRLRQLSDNLLTKQDALDSVLAQNHALKIRLERAQADNESLASALSTNGVSTDVHVRLPYQAAAYGCARLQLHNSPIPRSLRPVPLLLDNFAIRVTNHLRHWPMARLLLCTYIVFLHLWLLWAFFSPTPPSQPLAGN